MDWETQLKLEKARDSKGSETPRRCTPRAPPRRRVLEMVSRRYTQDYLPTSRESTVSGTRLTRSSAARTDCP